MDVTLIPAGYGLATLEFVLSGVERPKHVTFGFDYQGDGTTSRANLIYDAWTATGAAFAAAQMYSQWSLVACRTLQRVDEDLYAFEHNEVTTGTRTGNMLPPNVAFLVQKRSNVAGKRNRGRMFVPMCVLSETPVADDGSIDPTELALRQTSFTEAAVNLFDGDVPMVILHNTAGTPRPVTSLVCQGMVATQRRRLR